MKNFILKIISSIISGLILLTFMFFIGITLLSGKFPPDFKLVREYIDKMAHAKEHYVALLNRRQIQIDPESLESSQLPQPLSNDEQIKTEIREIKNRLRIIEQQNNEILFKLRNQH